MNIEQIYTGCLSQGAYYISDNGEAAVIDPLRETAPYLLRITKDKVRLKYIFETHFHADFVSGHVELAKKTGAQIVYGPAANTEFQSITAKDEEEFKIGELTIKVLHTPGHTLESTTYLLKDKNGKDHCIFTGDTLFLGDVGRPDLAQKSSAITKEDLAGLLYESLNNKLMPLADDVIVYPAHGAGSACGKNMMKETTDTLGNQKAMNYALNQPDKDSFIQKVTEGLTAPPAYFSLNAAMNKKNIPGFDLVSNNGMNALSADEFQHFSENTDALILDTRSERDFAKGFIERSVNIGLKGDFAPWAGSLITQVKQPLLLVTEEGKELETITRLSRVGFDKVIGFLKGGFNSWVNADKKTDAVVTINADQFEKIFEKRKSPIVDVRKETEFNAGHIEGAINKPLAYINDWINEICGNDYFFLHCAGGYRSMIAASILQARGCRNFTEITGGFKAITSTKIPLSAPVPASEK
jgi:hydroxyacylglutathione hydrolase